MLTMTVPDIPVLSREGGLDYYDQRLRDADADAECADRFQLVTAEPIMGSSFAMWRRQRQRRLPANQMLWFYNSMCSAYSATQCPRWGLASDVFLSEDFDGDLKDYMRLATGASGIAAFTS